MGPVGKLTLLLPKSRATIIVLIALSHLVASPRAYKAELRPLPDPRCCYISVAAMYHSPDVVSARDQEYADNIDINGFLQLAIVSLILT